MKYISKKVDDSVNIPGGNNGKTILGIAISLLLFLALLCGIFFFTIEYVVELIPISIEREYHLSWSGKKVSSYNEANIESLIKSLIKDSELKDFPFTVEIKKSSIRNAYIVPGGKIVIFSKLLEDMKTENELSFVMAHEIGHFYKRHHLKSFGKNVAFLLLSNVLFYQSDGSREILASSARLSLMPFSRRDESQADKFAVKLLHNHYGHIEGYKALFDILKKETGQKESLMQFIQTHPSSDNRIDLIKELAANNSYKLTGEQRSIAPYLSESK
jgi:beta-barrel assembly-enhancing protease